MRTVAVFAAHASSKPVWVWCRTNPVGDGVDRFTVTEPGGIDGPLAIDDAGIDMARATFLFTTQVPRSAIESDA